MQTEISTAKDLEPQLKCWKFLGAAKSLIDPNLHFYYVIYSFMLNVSVTILNPMHFIGQLFGNPTLSDDIKNLSITVVCVACSIKFVLFSSQLNKVLQFQQLLRQLDERVQTTAEKSYMKRSHLSINAINYTFIILFMCTGISVIGVTTFLLGLNRQELMYPAWFPFDWRSSKTHTYAAQLYNAIAIIVQVIQNFVDDSFPVVASYLVCVHVELLIIRLSQLGNNEYNLVANEQELRLCILDQLALFELFDKLQDIIWLPMFVQLAVSGFNVCLALAALLLCAEDTIEKVYFVSYLVALLCESFPICYVGSQLTQHFERLSYAIYSCNWYAQSASFKRNMLTFTERSLKKTFFIAGGIIPINLDTFISLCKGAYSLLALITNMAK